MRWESEILGEAWQHRPQAYPRPPRTTGLPEPQHSLCWAIFHRPPHHKPSCLMSPTGLGSPSSALSAISHPDHRERGSVLTAGSQLAINLHIAQETEALRFCRFPIGDRQSTDVAPAWEICRWPPPTVLSLHPSSSIYPSPSPLSLLGALISPSTNG